MTLNAKFVKANNVLYITVDRAAFLAEVNKYLDLSPVAKDWAQLKTLKWPAAITPPALWTNIALLEDMFSVVTAAVEVAKQKIIAENDPDGSKGAKFDNSIALATAVEILFSGIKFNGFVGSLISKAWKPFLNLLVSIYVDGLPAGDWLQIALTILKLAGVAAPLMPALSVKKRTRKA